MKSPAEVTVMIDIAIKWLLEAKREAIKNKWYKVSEELEEASNRAVNAFKEILDECKR